MTDTTKSSAAEWKALAKNDWAEILDLSKKKTFQRKFQIVEAFKKLVIKNGIYNVSCPELAKECKISRQLLEHHFASKHDLVLLTYRYIFAQLQKHAADAVVSKQDFIDQYLGYLRACADWTKNYKDDARFVIQFYAACGTDAELQTFYDRNRLIGQERIHNLLLKGQKEGKLKTVSDEQSKQLAASVQKLIIGYFVQVSLGKRTAAQYKQDTEELCRSGLWLIEFQARHQLKPPL